MRKENDKIEAAEKLIQSYESLASASTWSEKKQEQDKKQASSSRDERQKEMKYNNDPFTSPFSH